MAQVNGDGDVQQGLQHSLGGPLSRERLDSVTLEPQQLDVPEGDDAKRELIDDGETQLCETDAERFRLVDRAFDELGAGRYHFFLFMTASLGFFVEAAEMNMLSLLLPEFVKTWHVEEKELSVIGSFTGIGMMIGAFFFGRLSDIVGRKAVYQMSLALCVGMGFLSSYATSVMQFAVIRLFLGVAYGGNTVSAATLLIENTPTAWRGFFSAMTSFAFTAGYMTVVALSWAIMDEYGWQWVVRIVSICGIPACWALTFLPGSIRFYILRRNYPAAVGVIERIASANRMPMPTYFTVANLEGLKTDVNLSKLEATSAQSGCFGLNRLFRGDVLLSLVPLALVWHLNSFALAIITFLPLEISKRFLDYSDVKYKVAFGIAVGGVVGSCLVTFTASRLKRKTELRSGLIIMAMCTFTATHVTSSLAVVFLALVFQHVGMSLMFHGLYTYTPEVFPTSVRVTCFSVCQVAHRLAPVTSPYVVTMLTATSTELAGQVYSLIFIVALGFTFLLQRETFGAALVEDEDDELPEPEANLKGGYATLELSDMVITSDAEQLSLASKTNPVTGNNSLETI
eukprot:CAMPEP_0184516406 /NCGR_PEP_ID=MMETSP0198_2-20121128/5014_1 /TAXON_ID=1112570 /ORGANISM="Thraustochytrium sp., Strain LLF1b" /LENGTH=568 /DNA_ID=CAMNT_0026906729 /DNA_START=1014 /DNA_END=2720 /DNA_ORIENTATION=-